MLLGKPPSIFINKRSYITWQKSVLEYARLPAAYEPVTCFVIISPLKELLVRLEGEDL